MNKKISIKIGTLEESLAKFKEAWGKIKKGKSPKEPIETLHFENTFLLLKTLTPRRLELMQQLHLMGPSSIRSLAKALQRDYKNVFEDVKALTLIDLIVCEDKKYYVPWDVIKTEIPMVKKAA